MAIFDDSFVGTPGVTLNGFNDGPGAWSMYVGSNTTQAVIASSGSGIKLDSVVGVSQGMFFQALGASTVAGSSVAWVEGRMGTNATTAGLYCGLTDAQTAAVPNTGYMFGSDDAGIGFRVFECSVPSSFIVGATTTTLGDYLAMETTIGGASTSVKIFLNGNQVSISTRTNVVGSSSSMARVSGLRITQGAGHPILDPAYTRFRADVGLYPGPPSAGDGAAAIRARAITYYKI